MRIDVLTLFPEFIAQAAAVGVVGRAGERERLIPFIEGDFVLKVDFDAQRIDVDWDADF